MRRMEGVTHFLREARLAAQLSHLNIVETYDLGETEDGYFIAMEYVAGIRRQLPHSAAERT